MPSRLLIVLAAGVALTWALACSRGAPAASAHPVTISLSAPASPPEAAATAPAPPEPNPSPDEIAAIEHPRVAK